MILSYDTLIAPIDAAAASIEQAFMGAGQGLGQGLDAFDGIARDLSALFDTFQGGAMAEAFPAIGALAERLVAVGGALPRDVAALEVLAAGNDGIAKSFEGLLEHIRMMTIIANSARIEAAVFGEATGLDSFTAEMSALTATVKTAVGRCAADHATMTDRIHRLHAVQSGLDQDFRERLLGLACDLSDTFAIIAERQRRSRDVAEDLAVRSTAIARSAGTALMALQSGDAARQRLEHVAAALRLAQRIGQDGAVPVGSDHGAIRAALCELQRTQLADLVGSFKGEAGEIDVLLHQLAEDAATLVAGANTVVAEAGTGGGSFLSAFRLRLAGAAEMVGTCERARRSATEGMEALRVEVAQLSRTIADLGVTTRDLIVVGINAGLKAACLGAEGRSLMVIADELKRLAGLIIEMSSRLMAAYEMLVEASRRLEQAPAEPAVAADAGILSIIATLEDGDRTMGGVIAGLQDKARHFDAELEAVRGRFRASVSSVVALGSVVDGLAAAEPFEDSRDIAALHLEALLWPHYTMAREREIHVALLGPTSASQSAEAVDPDLSDFLFADAV